MKIDKKQRTMLAQTQHSVLSATFCVWGCVCGGGCVGGVCVCVWCPNFALVILPGKLITGDIKFLSKIKYFSDRPTRLSEPYVTRTKQLFCHGLKLNWLLFLLNTVVKLIQLTQILSVLATPLLFLLFLWICNQIDRKYEQSEILPCLPTEYMYVNASLMIIFFNFIGFRESQQLKILNALNLNLIFITYKQWKEAIPLMNALFALVFFWIWNVSKRIYVWLAKVFLLLMQVLLPWQTLCWDIANEWLKYYMYMYNLQGRPEQSNYFLHFEFS